MSPDSEGVFDSDGVFAAADVVAAKPAAAPAARCSAANAGVEMLFRFTLSIASAETMMTIRGEHCVGHPWRSANVRAAYSPLTGASRSYRIRDE